MCFFINYAFLIRSCFLTFFLQQARKIHLSSLTLFNSLSSLVVFINKNHRQHTRERTQKKKKTNGIVVLDFYDDDVLDRLLLTSDGKRPLDKRPNDTGEEDIAFQLLEAKTRGKENGELCARENRKLFVPELKIGTLDSLLALSDDLQKINGQIENVTQKIKRQIQEIGEHFAKESQQQRRRDNMENNNNSNNNNEAFTAQTILTVDGVPTEEYLTDFKWDEAKNPAKRQLRETVEKITEHVMKIDDELKMKLSEYVMAKNSLSTIARKTQGSLATRDLGDVVREEDMVETENLTTLLVTIPKFSAQDWLDSYETLAQFVVPRSSKMLKEENDYSLFTVTLFRRTVDSFKNAVREKNGAFQVRV